MRTSYNQDSKPIIYYKTHRTETAENSDLGLSENEPQNSNDVTTTTPVEQDMKIHENTGNSELGLSEITAQNAEDVTITTTHGEEKVTESHDLTETTSTVHETTPNVHPVTEDTEDIKYKHSRFVLSYSYWEQQTNALINMWSLQKWANKSGKLKVVEPFAVESVLEFPGPVLNKHQFTNALRFRDYFDLDHWTKQTAKLGIEPLASWEIFLKYANRKMILAVPSYGAKPPGMYVDSEIDNHGGCKFERDKIRRNIQSLLDFLHFEIIKIVCYAVAYEYKDILSFEKFNSYLIPDSNATIWFGYWDGIGRLTMIGDSTLDRAYGGIESVLAMVRPNPQITIDSRNYVKTVLNSDFREYTAINIRSARRYAEMVLRKHAPSEVMDYFTNCVQKLKNILDKSGSTSYFLSSDIGKFGDRTAYKLNDNDSSKLLQQILQVLYGNKTIDVYQNEFIKAANGVDDRGYLATMQKTITQKAKCLIVMGGYSTFQQSVVLTYKNGSQYNCVTYLCYEDPIAPVN